MKTVAKAGDEAGHAAVMPGEVATALVGDRSGQYVDATFGRGGHSRRLLASLAPDARLLVLDRDEQAIACANRLAEDDQRVRVCRGRFADLPTHLQATETRRVCGVLFDVGVSSPQLDTAERGFSFAADGPLDMRMDQRDALTAERWLNTAPAAQIAEVIRRYGEEHHARRVAEGIVRARPLAGTLDLARVVERAVPMPGAVGSKHPATRVFQAVRIHINDELCELSRGLDAALAALIPGGRLAAITFHSLEHRLVRRRLRQWTTPAPPLPRLPIPDQPPLAERIDFVGKGLRPTAEEVAANPRARGALLQAVAKPRDLAAAS